ncbi:hypothetical protein FB567DRAFT_551610 [Paraphoma chrysanthemicola]|uniref:Uncharacterized protein n=1 Tax=Paraphoma chrysanthemicola TaxID=798071 RepID=A0A8K0R0Y3_9PLEO|nr:hypothetical protein FB567DRAFT_551610 [Paraphoma chrysanthemicola]
MPTLTAGSSKLDKRLTSIALPRSAGHIVESSSGDDPYYARHPANLGNLASPRYQRTGLIDDLNFAIDALDNASILPDHHLINDVAFPHASVGTDHNEGGQWAVAFAALGSSYGDRFVKTEEQHLDEALLYFSQAVACKDSPPAKRAESFRHAINILAGLGRWEEACGILETLMDPPQHVIPRQLKNSDKQHQLSAFSSLTCFAAAFSLQAGKDAFHALQLLEAGWALTGASTSELRSDISELEDLHPDIADGFEKLREQLDSLHKPTGPPSKELAFGMQTQGTRLGEADEELRNLILGIRDYAGFERVLFRPSRRENWNGGRSRTFARTESGHTIAAA